MKHYLVLRKSNNSHSANWLVRASSLTEALTKYVIDQHCEWRDGFLTDMDEEGKIITYSHPLECIEAQEKTAEGWDIKEVNEQQWQANLAEVLCSLASWDAEDYAQAALPLFRKEHPNVEARSFAWNTSEGFLVTFYKSSEVYPLQIEIVERYCLTGPPWPIVTKWSGTYEDLVNILSVEATPVMFSSNRC